MGKSTSVPQFAGKIQKAGANLKAAQKPAIEKEALAAKRYMQTAARMAAGGDMRLSGMKGRKLDVGYKTVGDKAIVFARGPWGLTEYGASPHFITSKWHGGSRMSRARRLGGFASSRKGASGLTYGPVFGQGRAGRGAVNFKGGAKDGWRAYIRHPGTKGKHTWERRQKMLFHASGRNSQFVKTSVAAVNKAF